MSPVISKKTDKLEGYKAPNLEQFPNLINIDEAYKVESDSEDK